MYLISIERNGKSEAKVFRDPIYQEFVVKFYSLGEYQKEADYFTHDRDDALATAHTIWGHHVARVARRARRAP